MVDVKDDGVMSQFSTGATRDTSDGKLDFEGFLSNPVLHQFARYMNMNRLQSDGKLRDSDNWKKGFPIESYVKSGYRHFHEWLDFYYGREVRDRTGNIHGVAALCGLMFNCMGYLHEWLKENNEIRFDEDEPTFEMKERQMKVVCKDCGCRPCRCTPEDVPKERVTTKSQDKVAMLIAVGLPADEALALADIPLCSVCWHNDGVDCTSCPDEDRCRLLDCDECPYLWNIQCPRYKRNNKSTRGE